MRAKGGGGAIAACHWGKAVSSPSSTAQFYEEDIIGPDGQTGDPANTIRVSALAFKPFVTTAEEFGARADIVLAAVGFSLTDFDNPELRISHALVSRLLSVALEQTRERDLGLLAAERMAPHHLDFLEYGARAQPTLKEAFEFQSRYFALMHEGLHRDIQIAQDRATIRYLVRDLPPSALLSEYILAAATVVARRMAGDAELAPLEVHFAGPRPANTHNHERIFRAQLFFERPYYATVWPLQTLARPTANPEPGLARVLERHANELLQKLELRTSLLERVREIVRNDLTSGHLTADSLARQLGMTSRTLHRHLVTHNTTYRAVLDDMRREIALRCLRDPQISLRELGALLGFTTSAAFHRAFRRWTGTTAASFRRQVLSSPNC